MQHSHTAEQRGLAAQIGERLRWAREAWGMTQRQLAAHAGIHLSMVKYLENGQRAPSIFLAVSLCHILGISPQYLCWGRLEAVDPTIEPILRRDHGHQLTLPEVPLLRGAMPRPGKSRSSRPTVAQGTKEKHPAS